MIHYLNLTNGLGFCPELLAQSKNGESIRVIRIQSTTIERKNYIKLFMDLDHDLLFNLAIGNQCIVYDMGTNRPFSKTISYGIPLIRYIISRYWGLDYQNLAFRLSKSGGNVIYDCAQQFDYIYNNLFVFDSTKEKDAMKRKLRYYKSLVRRPIYLEGISRATDRDGDKEYFFNLARRNMVNNLNIKDD
jgi:hypothetical protein